MRAGIPIMLLGLVACEIRQDGGSTTPTPPPTPTPGPTTSAPVIAADGCGVTLWLEVSGASVVAMATNHTDAAVTLELPGRCPAQDVRLVGLPEGYDPDHTCAMGMCAEQAPGRWELAAGAEVSLASWMLDQEGCGGPLDGRFSLSIDASAATAGGATVCAAPAVEAEVHPREVKTHRCEPMPACGIGCPGPMAKDEHGCSLCACEDSPFP